MEAQPIKRTKEEKFEIVRRVDELRDTGLSIREALTQLGIGVAVHKYYAWRQDKRRFEGDAPARKKAQPVEPRLLGSFPVHHEEGEVSIMVVKGKPSEIHAVADKLGRLMGITDGRI